LSSIKAVSCLNFGELKPLYSDKFLETLCYRAYMQFKNYPVIMMIPGENGLLLPGYDAG
jgi:hypothetical protein